MGASTPYSGPEDEKLGDRAGPYRLEQTALAMRESSLVGKRVEGVCDGVGESWRLMLYNYRRREEAFVVKIQHYFG